MVPYGRVWSPLVAYSPLWFHMVPHCFYGPLWLSRMAPYGSICSLMVPYGPVWLPMVWYGLIWSCMVLYGPIGFSMVLYGPICFCIFPYVLVWLCVVPCGPVWSCMDPYDPLWSCMVFEILSSPTAILSPVRYQILADIESFAFLFLFIRTSKIYLRLWMFLGFWHSSIFSVLKICC